MFFEVISILFLSVFLKETRGFYLDMSVRSYSFIVFIVGREVVSDFVLLFRTLTGRFYRLR